MKNIKDFDTFVDEAFLSKTYDRYKTCKVRKENEVPLDIIEVCDFISDKIKDYYKINSDKTYCTVENEKTTSKYPQYKLTLTLENSTETLTLEVPADYYTNSENKLYYSFVDLFNGSVMFGDYDKKTRQLFKFLCVAIEKEYNVF